MKKTLESTKIAATTVKAFEITKITLITVKAFVKYQIFHRKNEQNL